MFTDATDLAFRLLVINIAFVAVLHMAACVARAMIYPIRLKVLRWERLKANRELHYTVMDSISWSHMSEQAQDIMIHESEVAYARVEMLDNMLKCVRVITYITAISFVLLCERGGM